MERDSGCPIAELRCDGGMTVNDLLMQFQADILDRPTLRPKVSETTALGAAYAAGLATGFWKTLEDLRDNWAVDKRWHPHIQAEERRALFAGWSRAVERSFGWVEENA